MLKYRLMQENDEINFNTIEDHKTLDNNNLKDIIKFTGLFKTQEELRTYLSKYKLVKTSKPFKISYKYGGKQRNLIYGVTYKDDLKFLSERNIKIFLYRNRLNYDLLNNLCNHYDSSKIQGGNIFLIRNYLRLLKRNSQVVLDDEREIVKEFEIAMDEFVRRECYRYDKKNEKYKENFRGIRDLGMFLSREIKKNNKLITDNMIDTNEFMEYQNDNIEKDINEERYDKKVKKKTYPGQLSFKFDQDGNIII